DGEYHTYVYDCSALKDWQGTATNWQLYWQGGKCTIGIRDYATSSISNRLPFAAKMAPGLETRLALLMPRAKCRLFWKGSKAGKVLLRFYDCDMNLIPDASVSIDEKQPSIEFAAPEMMIYANAVMTEAGEGFPVVQQIEYTRPFTSSLSWRGNWIWSQKEPGPMNRRVWFQRIIDLDEAPEYAVMAVGGDDRCYTYVNGTYLVRTSRWRETARYEIANLLKPGRNRILCSVHNDSSWGGFFGNIYIRTKGGEIYADTDEKWTCDPDSNIDNALPKDIAKPVVILGKASEVPPWTGRMTFKFAGRRGILEALELQPGRMKVRIREMPVSVPDRLGFLVKPIDGQGRQHSTPIPIKTDRKSWKPGAVVEIAYPVPYADFGLYGVHLSDALIEMQGDPELMRIDNTAVQRKPLKKARFVNSPRIMLQFGDELINPIFWHASNDMGSDHSSDWIFTPQAGFQAYRISASFRNFWKQDGTYDFSKFDEMVAQLLSAVPNAVFAVQVYAYMPEWWLDRNPDDTARHYGTGGRFKDLDKQALSSKKWLKDAEVPLKALIDHIKAGNFADRVWGMSFAENINGEWFWGSEDSNYKTSHAGFSKADLDAFRAALRRKYGTDDALAKAWKTPGVTFDTAQLPDPERPRKGSIGIFLDPEKDRQVMDWFEYRGAALAEAIIHFAKFAKEQSEGNWLMSAYFGYVAQLLPGSWRPLQIVGHNAFLEVAKSPYIDYVHAPLSYTQRKTGMPGMIM
ncbi:MAG: beta-galactosidase, partial [Victivallales bacterium]|nr:beta-galactosidase [Victivallales bacterium]